MPRARSLVSALLLCALLAPFVLACGGRTPEPIEFEPGAATPEGLRRVKREGPYVVYLKPGARIQEYSEILVDPFMISYWSGFQPLGSEPPVIRTLDAETEAKLSGAMRDAFVKSMQRSRHFSMARDPGPRALRVQGWIYDLVVGESGGSNPRNVPLCFAEISLILTVRGAETAQALALVAHRFEMVCDSEGYLDTRNWTDVTRAMEPWARFLRDHLDELHELTAVPVPSAASGTPAANGRVESPARAVSVKAGWTRP